MTKRPAVEVAIAEVTVVEMAAAMVTIAGEAEGAVVANRGTKETIVARAGLTLAEEAHVKAAVREVVVDAEKIRMAKNVLLENIVKQRIPKTFLFPGNQFVCC